MEVKQRYIDKIDKSKNVKLSNRLVKAKFKLSLIEFKIVLSIASQLPKSGECFERVSVSAAALIEFYGFSKKKGYSLLKKACCSLRKQVLEISCDDGSRYETSFVNSAHYHDGVIDFKFDEGLRKELLNVKQAYVSTSAEMLCSFTSEFTIRLYMCVKMALKLKKLEYGIDEIREMFKLPKSYGNIVHFKNKFLERCVAEINDKSDIIIIYRLVKVGKSYKKVKFTISTKKMEENIIVNTCGDLSREEKAVFDILTSNYWGVAAGCARELIKTYGIERCQSFIKWIRNKKERGEKIGSGLLIKMIKDISEPIPVISSGQMDWKKRGEAARAQIIKNADDMSKNINQNGEIYKIAKKKIGVKII